ncbi:MAG: putative sulfate exporter family transporter [Pseudomonadota bacterium]
MTGDVSSDQTVDERSQLRTLVEQAISGSQHALGVVPGLALAVLVAAISQLVADNSIFPAMLLALVFGLAINRVNTVPALKPGIAFGAKPVLRIGVALLGARISFEMVAELGWAMVSLLAISIAATIGFGLLLARMTNAKARFAVLSSGAVAICGASAAIAIASVLPKDEKSEDRLVFTIVGVTVLSTVAMVLYPLITGAMGLDDRTAGIFFGAAIHDVAQVVGAGFSVSDETGEIATLVKLLRVSMLAPTVLCIALLARRFAPGEVDASGKRTPLLPTFVIAFIVLAAINSFFDVPEVLQSVLATASGWMLLIAIAAVGIKTNLSDVTQVGGAAVAAITAQTVFIALFIAGGMALLAHWFS